MTLPTPCFLLLVSTVLIIISFLVQADNNNYPTQNHNPKPCARLNNTITYQKALCVPDCNGGFKSESETNCKEEFRKKCPEYNQGRCEWYNLTMNGSTRAIPTCRLCYYAKSKTWMEGYFSHQYGDWMINKDWDRYGNSCDVLVTLDVVEVHRHIKDIKAFGNRTQKDWPNNVQYSAGQRGLYWWMPSTPSNLPASILNSENGICSEATEYPSGDQVVNDYNRKLCEVDFVDYLKRTYPKGFDDTRSPDPSDDESTVNCNVSYILEGSCINVRTQEGIVTRGCQVLYTRSTLYTPAKGDQWKCEFVFMEYNAYNLPRTEAGKTPVQLRFAFWSKEDKNDRNKIFCNSRV